MEGEEEMVISVENLWKVGGESKGVRGVFQCSGAGGTAFPVGDMGNDTPSWAGPLGGFNTGYINGSLGGIPICYWTGAENI